MRSYLARSIASLNQNKLRGLLAINCACGLANLDLVIEFQLVAGLRGELARGVRASNGRVLPRNTVTRR